MLYSEYLGSCLCMAYSSLGPDPEGNLSIQEAQALNVDRSDRC